MLYADFHEAFYSDPECVAAHEAAMERIGQKQIEERERYFSESVDERDWFQDAWLELKGIYYGYFY